MLSSCRLISGQNAGRAAPAQPRRAATAAGAPQPQVFRGTPGGARRPAPPAQAAERPQAAESLTSLDISGLDALPGCSDFECKSSPAVEATIRSFARDVARCNGVWTRSLFAKNVEYKVGGGWVAGAGMVLYCGATEGWPGRLSALG